MHTWWVRSVCLTIAARAATTDSIASILCIHSPTFIHSNHIIRGSSSMCIRLAHTDKDMLITGRSATNSSSNTSSSNTSSSVGSELMIVAHTHSTLGCSMPV